MSATATFVSTEITSNNIQEEAGIQPPGLGRVQLNERRSSLLSGYSSKVTAQSLVGSAQVKKCPESGSFTGNKNEQAMEF